MLHSIKKFLIDFYYRNGKSLGKFLLTSMGISALLIVILLLISGQEFSFTIFLGWLAALPLFAAIVAIVRFIIKLVHKAIPMNPGLTKIIFDFIILAVVMSTLGYWLRGIEAPKSDFLQTAIILLFDGIYIFLTIFLLSAGRKSPGEQRETNSNRL